MSVSDFPYPGNDGAAPRLLAPPADGLSLYWCDVDRDDVDLAQLRSWLSSAENARAARFGRESLARRYIVGRAALRWVLGRHLATSPAHVPIVRGERGRPRLGTADRPDFNVSNTGGCALIALVDTPGTRVGVDIEHAERRPRHDALARKLFTPREQADLVRLGDDARRRAFLKLWTCKEAMSKATGDALAAPFRRLDVELASMRLVDGPPPYGPRDWTLLSPAAPQPMIATLALWRMPAIGQRSESASG